MLPQGFRLTIEDQTGAEIRLGLVQCEVVTELRDILLENVNTAFFTNYYFEYKGNRLDEYTEIKALNLEDDARFILREDEYDERACRIHLRRLQEVLYEPTVLNLITDSVPAKP